MSAKGLKEARLLPTGWLLLGVSLLVGCAPVSAGVSSLATASASRHVLQEQAVTVQDFSFSPATLTVPVGTTVTWTFSGPSPHTATSNSDASMQWDSGIVRAGGTYSTRFTQPGTYRYHCTLHPSMTGTIVVQ